MAKKTKKIGFLSAIVLVITSCIGAGIFFKSGRILNNVHQNFGLAISAWIIAAIGVMAMALALVEMCSVSVTSDKGFMEWNRKFNRRWVYCGCKNFMTFVFMPTTFFFMPLYGLQSILDAVQAFGLDTSGIPWWLLVIVAFLIDTWFMFMSGFSSRAANIQSWAITSIKFIPLFVAVVVGFVIFGTVNKGSLPPNINSETTTHPSWTLFGISPAFGLFASLSAVFFAYDGFYVACGINSQMKEPRKIPLVLVIGLSLVTVIYLSIAISIMLGTDNGNWFGFQEYFKSKGLGTLYGIFSIFISFGIFGIINCDAVWAPRFIEELIRDDDLFRWGAKYKYKLNPNHPKVGVFINYLIYLPIFFLFCVIGAFGYIDVPYEGVNSNVRKLYEFCDLTSTWNAVIVFGFIVTSIGAALINRFSGKIYIRNRTKLLFQLLSLLFLLFQFPYSFKSLLLFMIYSQW